METTPGVKASHLLAVDPLSLVSGVLLLATLHLVEEDLQAEEDHGERATMMAGIRQKEPEVQKAVTRRKDLSTRPKGAGAKEVAAVAVPGTRQMVVDGTAARVGTPAVVAAGGKLGSRISSA